MGCDIHSFAEKKHKNKWLKVGDVFPLDDFDREWHKKDFGDSPFDWRSYNIYGFLAGVRNYSESPVIVEPRGFPEDASKAVRDVWEEWEYDGHTASWITAKELLDFDYDKTFWNRRITKQRPDGVIDGAARAEEGEGEIVTFREFLGEHYFRDLKVLEKLGDPENVRIVFFFDN